MRAFVGILGVVCFSQKLAWTVPGNAQLLFGLHNSHPEPSHPDGFNLWVDEIAVGTDRIGCAQ